MAISSEFISTSVTEQEYKDYVSKLDLTRFNKSSEEEVEHIEDLLDLKRGVLKGQEFYVSKRTCEKCGKPLSFGDFVTTALKESSHTKPFLAHALLGNRYGFQSPRDVNCSGCGEVYLRSTYTTPNYSCPER